MVIVRTRVVVWFFQHHMTGVKPVCRTSELVRVWWWLSRAEWRNHVHAVVCWQRVECWPAAKIRRDIFARFFSFVLVNFVSLRILRSERYFVERLDDLGASEGDNLSPALGNYAISPYLWYIRNMYFYTYVVFFEERMNFFHRLLNSSMVAARRIDIEEWEKLLIGNRRADGGGVG